MALGIGLSALGFLIAVRTPYRALGGAMVGLAVAAIHYANVISLRGPILLQWNSALIAASVLGGAALSSLALSMTRLVAPAYVKLAEASLLSFCVLIIHFAGMAAVTVIPGLETGPIGEGLPTHMAAVVIGAAVLLIAALGLAGVHLDRYLSLRRDHENIRLKAHIAALEAAKHELDIALACASAANKSKTAFLAAMSHELRTPLNAIIGFSELLDAEPFGALGHPRYKSYSQDIRKAGEHLLSLINDILDISRLEARKAELIESQVALGPLLEEALDMVRSLADDAGVTLALAVQPDLPLLWADNRRVKQIVLNLLSNAVKFTERGGEVQLRAGLKNGAVEITVSDTGIGIAPQDLPKAFESFGQIDSRLSRKYEGSGLGLPLARHLAELHGGSLTIESQRGVGTVARLQFPVQRSILTTGENAA
jgi:signal transduction histidine kinase